MKKGKKSKLVFIISFFLIVGVLTTAVITGFNYYKSNLNNKREAANAKAQAAAKAKLQAKAEVKHHKDLKVSKISTPQKQTDAVEMARQAAAKYIGSKDVGVYCIELNSGKSFGINQDKVYYAASTGKLPEILYTQKKLNQGIVRHDTKFQYHDYVNNIPGAMIRGGTGILKNNLKDGELVSVDTLLKYACSYSDNLAANMIGYYICDKNDGEFKSYIGSVLSRNITTFSKYFSARDIAVLMNTLYIQNHSGGQAISYLQNTNWDNVKIPKYLPVKTAHKIGINGAYNHDVAIVYAKNPYIISIMTRGENDEFISQLSKRIYDVLTKS